MKLLGRYHNFIEPDSEMPSPDGEPSSNGARPPDHEANIVRSATHFLCRRSTYMGVRPAILCKFAAHQRLCKHTDP